MVKSSSHLIINLEFDLKLLKSNLLTSIIMAVPIYTPEEDGENNENNNGENETSGSSSSSVCDQESSGGSSSSITTPSLWTFLGQLVKELVGIYQEREGRRVPNSNPIRMREPSRQPPPLELNNNDIILPLPDLITSTTRPQPPPLPSSCCCHVQALRPLPLYENNMMDQQEIQQRPRRRITNGPTRHQDQTTNRDDVDSDPSGLSLDIKMQIDFCYRRIGRDLRSIADAYENQEPTRRHHRRRRRHPAGRQEQPQNPENKSSLKFNFSLKVVIPISFLGLSLALLRRN